MTSWCTVASSPLSLIAEEFAEQKILTSPREGVDTNLLRSLWKANALEVLVFALPRLGLDVEEDSAAVAPLVT